MDAITHHAPDPLLADYAAGSLPHPYALVLAAHISMCPDCRATFESHQAAGGAILGCHSKVDLSVDLKAQVMDQLHTGAAADAVYKRSGVYPGPVMEVLKAKSPRWKPLGMGVRQCMLSRSSEGSARLLYIPSGQAVPDHSHNGLELTLVLQGSFGDKTGQFGVGDLEIADQTLDHTPIAGAGLPCICLAATDAPLRFTSLVPKLLQPLFRI